MNKARHILPVLLVLWTLMAGSARGVTAWRLDLPREVQVSGMRVTLADLAEGPVPAAQGQVAILGQGQPGSVVSVDRRTILRKLVQADLADGVVFGGATEIRVCFGGHQLEMDDIRQAVRQQIQHLVPLAIPGAPGSYFDLQLPANPITVGADFRIEVQQTNPLRPGRNQVRVRVQSKEGYQDLGVMVFLHHFGHIPVARSAIERDTPLTSDLFTWEWLDLSELKGQFVTAQAELLGNCVGRTLSAGDRLRQADLKPIPAIEAGDLVELQIQRGNLLVTVKALARQAGCLGQTIPVRNELNGRLVNARVTAPGLVEWRR